jgi:hypothetical protein
MSNGRFTSDNQPAKRGDGSWQGTKKMRDAMQKLFDDGKIEGTKDFANFEEWVVYKAITEGGMYLDIAAKRIAPAYKATLEPIKIDYPRDGTAVQKADAVYNAIADGEIPPDVGQTLIDALSKMLNIEELTDLKARLERIEEILNKQ